MKICKLILCMIGLILVSCSKNDDGPNIGGDSENSSKVVINANGTTSTNAKFTPISDSSFLVKNFVSKKLSS